MTQPAPIRKIAFIGDYLPRKCGIATFTHDVRTSVAQASPGTECLVVPVNDDPRGYDYPHEVRFEIQEQDLETYLQAADFLNFANTDIVCLQHEFGIFGGPAGRHVLALLRDLRMPVATTLHTILQSPSPEQREVMEELIELSARLIVMTERGKRFLREVYGAPESKIDLIAHGIPDMAFVDPNFHKDQFGVEGKLVALTFGLISPNKGIEHMLRALPAILEEFPNFVYIVLGATHPNLVREQGERYRLGLERMCRDLGIKKNVIFYNRFVETAELIDFLGSADVYVTPYLNPAQITSGTLAYAFGCGKAVISTPYWHAEELLAEGRGVIVPFADSNALTEAVLNLFRDEPRRHAMRKKAYLMGREMIWSYVSRLYLESFERAKHGLPEPAALKPLAVRTLDEQREELPDWRLDHLRLLTDSTGILQHATFTIPTFSEGYCTDDNARALLLTVLLDDLGVEAAAARRLGSIYAAFIQHAFNPALGRFRNFLGFDRHWLEEVGSDDSHGRAVWALGACVGRSSRTDLPMWASQLFEQALPPVLEMTSPRSWAFALLGVLEYLRRLGGDRLAAHIRDQLASKLLERFQANAAPDWPWLEDVVAYDNPRISQALIACGRAGGPHEALEVGLQSLRWLVTVQKSPQGCFRAVGCNGFYRRGGEPALFDQQPLEAAAMVSACLEAARATRDRAWWNEARYAFEWFLGRNDLGLDLYDPSSGGCRDGLQQDRTNQNQGAESTLAFLLALAEMHSFEVTFRPFRGAAGVSPIELKT